MLGWATIKGTNHPAPTPSPKPTATAATSSKAGSSNTTTLTTTLVTTTRVTGAVTGAPTAPVTRGSELTDIADGDAGGKLRGTRLTLTIPTATPLHWVYLYAYTGAQVSPVGWGQVTSNHKLTVDLAELGDGLHRIVAVAADGTVLGWVETRIGAEPTPSEAAIQESTPTESEPSTTPTITATTGPVAVPAPATAASGSQDPVVFTLAGLLVIAGAAGGLRLGRSGGDR